MEDCIVQRCKVQCKSFQCKSFQLIVTVSQLFRLLEQLNLYFALWVARYIAINCTFLLFCGVATVCGDGCKFQFGLPKSQHFVGIP